MSLGGQGLGRRRRRYRRRYQRRYQRRYRRAAGVGMRGLVGMGGLVGRASALGRRGAGVLGRHRVAGGRALGGVRGTFCG